jgi:2-oxoglutarate dehydrogenase E2 component (dihydrolipoamide succinyltransferase)
MSFIKACTTALMEFPQINAFIERRHRLPPLRAWALPSAANGALWFLSSACGKRSYAELSRASSISSHRPEPTGLSDLEGGTFTISNGGVYGSLLSTPILNMPQSGILGMHKIEKRPVVIEDEIVVRPMMYVALSYDHRIVDGREAVTFLKRIKESIEDPQRIMLEI